MNTPSIDWNAAIIQSTSQNPSSNSTSTFLGVQHQSEGQNGHYSAFDRQVIDRNHESSGNNPGGVMRFNSTNQYTHNSISQKTLNEPNLASGSSMMFDSESKYGKISNSHESSDHRNQLWQQYDSRTQSNSVDSFMNPRYSDLTEVASEIVVPLSLTAQELTLEESKTYMRWYSDILARVNRRTATMADILLFLYNFKISHEVRLKITNIFHKIHHSINIGEFFALLRLVGHALNGVNPERYMIKVTAPVPSPHLILSKKRQNEDDGDLASDSSLKSNSALKPLDLDGFTQFLLTGNRPDEPVRARRSKKLKSVKFSDIVAISEPVQPSSVPGSAQSCLADESLLMNQLLDRMRNGLGPQIQPSEPPIDLVNELLRPNNTGPAQIADYFELEPQLLKPNMTGPAQMAEYYNSMDARNFPSLQLDPINSTSNPKISLQLFTEQMTGNTLSNTLQNSGIDHLREKNTIPASREPWAPPATTVETSSNQSPDVVPRIRMNVATSLNDPQQHFQSINANDTGTRIIPGTYSNPRRKAAPPPPPSRRRFASPDAPAPPLPPKVSILQNQFAPNSYLQFQNSSPALTSANSTANILDDLKALQEEVDRIGHITGGF